MTSAVVEPQAGSVMTSPLPGGNATTQIAQSRAAQEAQAMVLMAKYSPRDETAAINRIMESCNRQLLAEQAMYSYPRGGTTVTGPSIRLAEEMARQWGNLDFGIVELDQRDGESIMQAYCWDLETNTRQTKVFTVKHERHKKGGVVTHLTDPRDVYEMTANQGARRLRSCILGVIPGYIQEQAIIRCEKTLAGENEMPLIDRVRAMVRLLVEFGVTQEMIEGKLGHRIDATSLTELVQLRKIYQSLKDNMTSREDHFDVVAGDGLPDGQTRTDSVREKLAAKAAEPDGQPKASKTDAKPASDSEPSWQDKLVDRFAAKHDITGDGARKRLDEYAKSLIGSPLADLDNKGLTRLGKDIDAGAVKPKGYRRYGAARRAGEGSG